MPDDERANDSRERILQVATALSAEHGYHGISMRALSNAAQTDPFVLEQIAAFRYFLHDCVCRILDP